MQDREPSEYLLETIGRLLPLTWRDDRFIAACPFHDDDSRHLSVNPETNAFHCFVCETHGHAEDFPSAFTAARMK